MAVSTSTISPTDHSLGVISPHGRAAGRIRRCWRLYLRITGEAGQSSDGIENPFFSHGVSGFYVVISSFVMDKEIQTLFWRGLLKGDAAAYRLRVAEEGLMPAKTVFWRWDCLWSGFVVWFRESVCTNIYTFFSV